MKSKFPEDIHAAAAKLARAIDLRYDPPNEAMLDYRGPLISDEAYTAYMIAEALLAERESKAR